MTVLSRKITSPRFPTLRLWWPVLLGLLGMYLPTYNDLASTFWSNENGAHGPIILGITLFLMWRERSLFMTKCVAHVTWSGLSLFALGLLLYILGHSQSFFQFEVISQLPLLLGAAGILLGREGTRRLWFPILFLAFLVPVPGSIMDQFLLPLKQAVSAAADTILYRFAYPIARSGAVLIIGPYRLLIADACSGLNSMVALSGIGLLYVYLVGHKSSCLNAILLLSILPVAFIANIIRVLILVLITYYYGDSAGHAFHDHAGYLEIVLAFCGFFVTDWLLMCLVNKMPITSGVGT